MAAIIIILIINFFLAKEIGYNEGLAEANKNRVPVDTTPKVITTTRIDTVIETKTKYITLETKGEELEVDTNEIISSHPYHAGKDTILGGDTISVSFWHPSRFIYLNVRQKLDSIIKITKVDSITITKPYPVYVPEKRTTWEVVKEHTPTGVVGYILGGITVLILKR